MRRLLCGDMRIDFTAAAAEAEQSEREGRQAAWSALGPAEGSVYARLVKGMFTERSVYLWRRARRVVGLQRRVTTLGRSPQYG